MKMILAFVYVAALAMTSAALSAQEVEITAESPVTYELAEIPVAWGFVPTGAFEGYEGSARESAPDHGLQTSWSSVNDFAPSETGSSSHTASASVSEGWRITVTSGSADVSATPAVEGSVAALLSGAVGTARVGSKAKAEVSHGGGTQNAESGVAVAICAGTPGTVGISTEILGISMSYVAASASASSDSYIDVDPGSTREASEVVVSYVRRVFAEYNTTMGKAEVETVARTRATVNIKPSVAPGN